MIFRRVLKILISVLLTKDGAENLFMELDNIILDAFTNLSLVDFLKLIPKTRSTSQDDEIFKVDSVPAFSIQT